MWLSKVEESTGEAVKVDWKPFSLAQVNSDNNDNNVKLWEQPEVINGTDKTFLAHMSGLAAKRQGEEAFQSFFMALLRARHEDKKDLEDPAVMEDAAAAAGLDMARWREDAGDATDVHGRCCPCPRPGGWSQRDCAFRVSHA